MDYIDSVAPTSFDALIIEDGLKPCLFLIPMPVDGFDIMTVEYERGPNI